MYSKQSQDPSHQTHFDVLGAPQNGSSRAAEGEETYRMYDQGQNARNSDCIRLDSQLLTARNQGSLPEDLQNLQEADQTSANHINNQIAKRFLKIEDNQAQDQ